MLLLVIWPYNGELSSYGSTREPERMLNQTGIGSRITGDSLRRNPSYSRADMMKIFLLIRRVPARPRSSEIGALPPGETDDINSVEYVVTLYRLRSL